MPTPSCEARRSDGPVSGTMVRVNAPAPDLRPPGPAATSRWVRPGRGEHQLRGVRPRGDRRRALPVRRGRRHRRGDPLHADRADAGHLARRRARAARRASATASAPTAPGSRRAAGCSTRPSCCSTPTPGRSAARWSPTARSTATAARRRDLDEVRAAQRGPAATSTPRRTSRARSSCTTTSTGATTSGPAAAPVDRHDRLRAARQGVHRSCTTRCPRTLRGTYAGLTTNAAVHYLKDLGVTTVELLPVHQFVSEPRPRRARADELLGLQLDRLLRPARRPTAPPATAASRSPSSRRWSRRCTRPGSR